MEPDHAKEREAEIELLKRIGQGDRGSFEELYDRFSGLLFSTAYRVLNNQVAAEDVLQDVFIQIWEKAPLYNPALGKPLTWAVTLTRNKAIDRLRATERRNRLQDDLQRPSLKLSSNSMARVPSMRSRRWRRASWYARRLRSSRRTSAR